MTFPVCNPDVSEAHSALRALYSCSQIDVFGFTFSSGSQLRGHIWILHSQLVCMCVRVRACVRGRGTYSVIIRQNHERSETLTCTSSGVHLASTQTLL